MKTTSFKDESPRVPHLIRLIKKLWNCAAQSVHRKFSGFNFGKFR
jgi:hypothetical protein